MGSETRQDRTYLNYKEKGRDHSGWKKEAFAANESTVGRTKKIGRKEVNVFTRRVAVRCIVWLDGPGIVRRMRFELEDFEGNEILPLIDPPIEKLRGIRLHKLVTVISIFLYPTIDIKQAVGKHSSFLTEAVVHSCFAPRSECLDDHVSHASCARNYHLTRQSSATAPGSATGSRFDQCSDNDAGEAD